MRAELGDLRTPHRLALLMAGRQIQHVSALMGESMQVPSLCAIASLTVRGPDLSRPAFKMWSKSGSILGRGGEEKRGTIDRGARALQQ